MAPEIKWSEKSILNLLHIFNYIANDSKFYAERFTKKLVISVESQLTIQPNSGRVIPEFYNTDLDFLKEEDNAVARAGLDLLDLLIRNVRDCW